MINAILRHIELLRDKVPDWDAYPFSIPAVKGLRRLEFHPAVTFFVGENGSGKSTLIEAIVIKAGYNPGGGTKNFRGSARPTESELHNYLRLARGARRERSGFFLRGETMFNVFTESENYGWETLHEKSHGEAFLWVALNTFRAGGLFILDEPESALSPQRQLAFLCRMRQLVNAGSQFVISTHSPILMAYPEARIYMLDQEGIRDVRYEDTEHYAITKAFLQNPGRMLREMFQDIDNESDR
ncbi:MAG: AAA family ATPase [Polyangiaceae bacterium]|nr:AAA family ATPase [Polyangiaceae bacterium]NUQ75529.1 AAA family ATPase [Polyangiaceae bacterium]